MKPLFGIAGLAVLASRAVFCQTATPPSFEVADIRVNQDAGEEPSGRFLPGGRLELRRFSLKEIISTAYNVEDDRVEGGPSWLASDRFDVIAKAAGKPSKDDLYLMLQGLLAERFKLVVRHESKVVPVFALIVKKGGPKFRETTAPESATRVCKRENPDEPNRLGVRVGCSKVTMPEFVIELSNRGKSYIDKPIVDLTGLKGAYDFTITWTPKAALDGRKAADGTVISEPEGGLSLFAALQTQLGLALEERKQPMPLIVVESVQRRPTDN
jgi:uncharacterized protein (TIGR03435 family)